MAYVLADWKILLRFPYLFYENCVFIIFLYLKIDIKNIKVANVTPKYMFLSCKITFLHSMFDIYQFDSYTWSPKI